MTSFVLVQIHDMTRQTIRRHVWVSGRVQGVFFRQSAADEGRRLGIAGWVKNLADGRVEGVAEGPPAEVEAWVRWCHEGPPAARVNGVEVHDEPPEGANEFKVLS